MIDFLPGWSRFDQRPSSRNSKSREKPGHALAWNVPIGSVDKAKSRMTGEGRLMQNRDEIARRYGFASFAELLDVSDPLPMMPGDIGRSYVARDARGYWFVWEEGSPATTKADGITGPEA